MKDRYFRKELYAARKHNEVAKDAISRGVLNEDQTDAIGRIASLRHKIHSFKPSDLSDYRTNEAETFYNLQDSINEILADSNLPGLYIQTNLDDLPTLDDYDYVLSDEEKEQYMSAYDWAYQNGVYEQISDAKEQVNDEIEKWLRMIDKKYGTSFAPTGYARLEYMLYDSPIKNIKMTNAKLSRMSKGV